MGAGHVADGHRPPGVERLLTPEVTQALGTVLHGLFEVQCVLERETPVDVDYSVGGGAVEVDVEGPVLGCFLGAAFGFVGVVEVDAHGHGAFDLGVGAGVQDGGEHGVDVGGGLEGEVHGELGEAERLPLRHVEGQDPFPGAA